MILEERDYKLVPGRMTDFLAAYETLGLPIQKEYLGGLVGYFTSDIGELNHVVSFWRYDSLADREARRSRMLADPHWSNYLASIAGTIDTQSIRILNPTAFSPLA